jgi:hypothetical protein
MAHNSPSDVLFHFISAMHDWERRCAETSRKYGNDELDLEWEDIKAKALSELVEIFASYCSEPPKRDYHYSRPPEYNPKTEHILNTLIIGDSQAVIATQPQTRGQFVCVYTLVTMDEEWKLVAKYRLMSLGELISQTL